jgi:ribosomal subunit interface protein
LRLRKQSARAAFALIAPQACVDSVAIRREPLFPGRALASAPNLPRLPALVVKEAFMKVLIAGKQIDVGDALRARITEELTTGIEKYFSRATEAHVTVAKAGPGFAVDCDVHLASGISLQAQGSGGDAHAAFDSALTKIEKRVRRYKRRLRNHHTMNKSPLPAEDASAYVLAPFKEDEESELAGGTNGADPAPLVIAETKMALRTMPVAMAVLQLELTETPALMFRNAGHGGLNVVYRRADGNIGWIDPERPAA